MATPSLALAHRMGEGGRRPGEGLSLGRGEGELETFFNATGLADLSRRNPMKAEIRLGALESDWSRRNQMKVDAGGRRRETWRASWRLQTAMECEGFNAKTQRKRKTHCVFAPLRLCVKI